MTLKINIGKYRILVIAIFLSLAAHVFWLSAIKVETYKSGQGPIRFSKVSFLGPILDGGTLELNISPRSGSFLEDRYLAELKAQAGTGEAMASGDYAMDRSERYFGVSGENAIVARISGVMAGVKPQPSDREEY